MRKGYDIDGVLNLDEYGLGLRPSSVEDVIITGRSFEEEVETRAFLELHGIGNKVYFNPRGFDDKTRKTSGEHKGITLNSLRDAGHDIKIFYEDDEIQIKEIQALCPWIQIIHVKSNLVEKENVKRD